MILDPTIHIGDVIAAIAMVGGSISIFVMMRSELKAHGHRLYLVEGELKKQTDILVNIARQDEQIKNLFNQLAEIKRGRS